MLAQRFEPDQVAELAQRLSSSQLAELVEREDSASFGSEFAAPL
jgi:hypothetical protein